MNKFLITCAAATLMGTAAFAQDDNAMTMPTGDIAAGEAAFGQCATCHVVQNEAGETLAGRNAKTGPNLYGIAGRKAGIIEDFRYSPSMVEAGEKDMIWNEVHFVAYVKDPTGYLREYLDDKRARGKMAYKVRADEDAINLYAYLYSLAPPAEGEAAPATN